MQGARQVGKTWLMKDFGKQEFDNTVYLNFESSERLKNLFSVDFDIQRIDKKGNLWVSTTLNGFYNINKQDNKVTNYNQNHLKSLTTISILCVKPDSHRLVWIGLLHTENKVLPFFLPYLNFHGTLFTRKGN